MISPLAGITKTKPGFATLPLPGVQPILVDEKGNVLFTEPVDETGKFKFRKLAEGKPYIFEIQSKDSKLCDELEIWMDEVETQLSSEDHGKDIISVSALLKKHQVLLFVQ